MLLARGGRGRGSRRGGRGERELAFEHLLEEGALAASPLVGRDLEIGNAIHTHRHRHLGLGLTLEGLLNVITELLQFVDLPLGGNGGIDKQVADEHRSGDVVVKFTFLLLLNVNSVGKRAACRPGGRLRTQPLRLDRGGGDDAAPAAAAAERRSRGSEGGAQDLLDIRSQGGASGRGRKS